MFVQSLNQTMSLQIPHEQVKVLDHPKLQVFYFESVLAYSYILFEKHVILTLYISQDGFHEKWEHGLVAELTMELVQLWAIDTVVATSQRAYELQNTLQFQYFTGFSSRSYYVTLSHWCLFLRSSRLQCCSNMSIKVYKYAGLHFV